MTEIRTEQLDERFEISRYIGKALLTGKDVPAEFLMRRGASALKKLVGHDFLSAERKHSNGTFDLRGEFDVIITCNSRLRVNLEGDADAWRRRLLIFDFCRRRPVQRIPEFAKKLLAEEGAGILNWMIEGAILHEKELKQTGELSMTAEQKNRVERLLAESDRIRKFVRTCLKTGNTRDAVIVDELKQAYVVFCEKQGWHPAPLTAAENDSPTLIEEIHETRRRNDLRLSIRITSLSNPKLIWNRVRFTPKFGNIPFVNSEEVKRWFRLAESLLQRQT